MSCKYPQASYPSGLGQHLDSIQNQRKFLNSFYSNSFILGRDRGLFKHLLVNYSNTKGFCVSPGHGEGREGDLLALKIEC